MKKRNLELYLHIPFCVRKCNYCDFFSASGTEEEQAAYVSAMRFRVIRNYLESIKFRPFSWEAEHRLF